MDLISGGACVVALGMTLSVLYIRVQSVRYAFALKKTPFIPTGNQIWGNSVPRYENRP